MSGVVSIQSPEQLERVIAAAGPGRVVIRFHRPGCPACVRITGPYNAIAQRGIMHQGRRVVFVDVDTSKNVALARAFAVNAVPTFMAVDGGRFRHRFAGADEARLLRLATTGSS